MKVLITGGSGFIGTNLIELFIERGYDVYNFDKNPPLNEFHEEYWNKGDLLTPSDIEGVILEIEPDIVIHLAARTDTLSDVLDDYVDNTTGTSNLLSALRSNKCLKHLIVASTQYVYKSASIPFPKSDTDFAPYTVYGQSKVITEQLVRESKLNCKWTIVRPTNIWGPWHMRYPVELWKMISKGIYMHPGSKPVIRTYGYVKNICHQIDGIINSPEEVVHENVFYLGDDPIDSYIWLNELSIGLCQKKLKRLPFIVFFMPALFGTVLRKLNIPFPLYNTRLRNMVEDYYAPSNLTVMLFGVRNTSISDNVLETIDWLKNVGVKHFEFWRKKYVTK